MSKAIEKITGKKVKLKLSSIKQRLYHSPSQWGHNEKKDALIGSIYGGFVVGASPVVIITCITAEFGEIGFDPIWIIYSVVGGISGWFLIALLIYLAQTPKGLRW